MQIKKSLLVAGAVATIGVASAAAGVSAATSSNGETGNTIVDKIATRFSLDKNEVQKVFDENRAENEAERKAKLEARLDEAVKEGKITEEQKAKILAKMEELKSQMESHKEEMKDKTPEERKTLMEQHRAELEKWADDNDIPLEYLMFKFIKHGGGPGHGGGEFHMRVGGPDDGPTTDVQAN